MKIRPSAAAFLLCLFAAPALLPAAETKPVDPLPAEFQNPPASARPWVYWFWNNGNVTEDGIKADLDAMKQAGIGGVILMDVLERFAPPAGDADYMSPKWQKLMTLALDRARKNGLEINLTNGPGWCGSSGPWITPELSMQTLVSSRTEVSGPGRKPVTLPVPPLPKIRKDVFSSTTETKPFYRDVAVLAWPKRDGASPSHDGAVSPDEVIDVTQAMDKDGRLNFNFPAGEWVVERIGHTSTGSSTRPPVKGGNGLEADKFSAEAIKLQFDKVVGLFAKTTPHSPTGGLVATHVDSWEVGSQNWTANFAAEFKQRRGYDLTKYLPLVASGDAVPAIGTPEEANRFHWDFAQTCSELLAENYIGTLAKLAHKNGLRFTLEGYNLPFGDEAEYTANADEPMTEFWSTGGRENARKAHEMASVGHTTGRRVIGAEAFTAQANDTWMLHPALIKSMGDYQMAQGVNRFVIHRYAMQPYADRYPGATMGPWGLHYERTNTWWPMTGAWHEYLSRCQFLLRQGQFVADALYLRHQRPNQTYFDENPSLPEGYRADDISAEQLIARATVKDGRIVLPDGMSYALLVVPNSPMTPELVRKIAQLVEQGATVYGPRPMKSPSLANSLESDKAVAEISGKVWDRVIDGKPLEDVLRGLTGGPDLRSTANLNWLHRTDGDREIYFVANPNNYPVIADTEFRVKGKAPQWWNPETGETKPLARVESTDRGTRVKLPLAQNQSGFVVFQPDSVKRDYVKSVTRDGQPADDKLDTPQIAIASASYGPAGDAARTIDAKSLIEDQLRQSKLVFPVTALAEPRDPAAGVVKTLHVVATVNGKPFEWSGTDGGQVNFLAAADLPEVRTTVWGTDKPDAVVLASRDGGEFRLTSASGKTASVTLPEARKIEIHGPWTVSFPPKWGAPDKIEMDELADLSKSKDEGVRHFSGISTYETAFDFAPAAEGPGRPRYWLDLGELEVMGQVTLNGKKLGTVWNRPARIEVTDALKPGRNDLVVQVANTWQNRMIGDSALPKTQHYTWSSYEPFKPDSPLPKSGLLGPVTIDTERDAEVEFR